MCVICIHPAGVSLPDHDELTAMNRKNPDGIGIFAETEGGEAVVKTFLRFSDFYEFYVKNVTEDTFFVLHNRIGTSGTRDLRNCHPFPFIDDAGRQWFLFHNGIVRSYAEPGSSLCDTAHIAEAMYGKSADEVRSALEKLAAVTGSRFIAVSPGGNYTHGVKNDLISAGTFFRLRGNIYSNLYWCGGLG